MFAVVVLPFVALTITDPRGSWRASGTALGSERRSTFPGGLVPRRDGRAVKAVPPPSCAISSRSESKRSAVSRTTERSRAPRRVSDPHRCGAARQDLAVRVHVERTIRGDLLACTEDLNSIELDVLR